MDSILHAHTLVIALTSSQVSSDLITSLKCKKRDLLHKTSLMELSTISFYKAASLKRFILSTRSCSSKRKCIKEYAALLICSNPLSRYWHDSIACRVSALVLDSCRTSWLTSTLFSISSIFFISWAIFPRTSDDCDNLFSWTYLQREIAYINVINIYNSINYIYIYIYLRDFSMDFLLAHPPI